MKNNTDINKSGQEAENSFSMNLLICAVTISLLTAVAVIFIGTNNFGGSFQIDAAANMVSALAIITAVLIGFQIWNIVQLDERLKKEKEEIVRFVDRQMRSIASEAIGFSLSSSGAFSANFSACETSQPNEKREKLSLSAYLLLQSLIILSMPYNDEGFGKSAWDSAVSNLSILIRDNNEEKMNVGLKISMPRKMKIECMNAVSKIEDNLSRDLILNFLDSDAIKVLKD